MGVQTLRLTTKQWSWMAFNFGDDHLWINIECSLLGHLLQSTIAATLHSIHLCHHFSLHLTKPLIPETGLSHVWFLIFSSLLFGTLHFRFSLTGCILVNSGPPFRRIYTVPIWSLTKVIQPFHQRFNKYLLLWWVMASVLSENFLIPKSILSFYDIPPTHYKGISFFYSHS